MTQAILVTIALFLLPQISLGGSATVLQIYRVNFKPEKRLVYELNFNGDCEITKSEPFDVYYRENKTGQRLEKFSNESQRYFGPQINSNDFKTYEIPLHFRALTDIQEKLGTRAQILVRIFKENGKCEASAEITYRNKRFTLKSINIKMEKTLGIPTGVAWVMVNGLKEDGSPYKDCVAGECL
jgi:hypothetical protein